MGIRSQESLRDDAGHTPCLHRRIATIVTLLLALGLLLPPAIARQNPDNLEAAGDIRDSDPAQALEIARDTLETALEAGNQRLAALARLEMAHALEVLGGHDEALRLLDQIRSDLQAMDDPGYRAEALQLRGAIQFYKGRHDSALSAFQQAYEIFDRMDHLSGRAETLNRMGRVHDAQGNTERALDYYRQSMEGHERAGNLDGMATQLNNIGTLQRQAGNTEAALDAYRRSIELRERTGNLRDMAGTYNNIAVLHHYNDAPDEALEWIDRALSLQRQIGDRLSIARSLYNRAAILRAHGRTDEAMTQFRESLEIARDQEALELQEALFGKLSEMTGERGNYEQALNYSRQAAEVRSQLFDLERQREIEAMNARFETSRKEREIALLEEERRFNTLVRNSAIGGSLLMLVLIGVTYNRYRLKVRANQTIQRRNEELSTLDGIVAAINSQEEFTDVLAILLEKTVSFFPNADQGLILILDPSSGHLQPASTYGMDERRDTPAILTLEDARHRYRHGGVEIAEGVYLHDPRPAILEQEPWHKRPPRVSLVAMTLAIDGQVEGYLLLTNGEDQPAFRPHDAERFARIREHAISALARARHMEHLKDENLRAEEAICRLRIAERNLKQAVEDAEKANAIKSDFLARMSHELRTPLNAIIGYSEMLAKELRDSEHQGFIGDAQRIRSAGQHLLTLINELLDLSKIEAGKTEIHLVDCPVRDLLEDVTDMIQPQVEENGNRLQLECDPAIDRIRTDPVRLRQILFNLLANAAKFTEQGEVSLTALPDNGDIVFRVADNGIGMTPEQTRRVFDSFAQADESIGQRFGGTGLGLSVSRGLSQLLGGDIRVSSKLGEGSVFTVRLPLRNEGEVIGDPDDQSHRYNEPSADNRSVTDQERGRRGKVLVVEDNTTNSDMLARHLELEGYTPLLAADGPRGIRLAETERPAIILMDMSLPGMDGWETTRRLKNNNRTANIPIIGLSAHAMEKHRDEALAAGCDEYEHKPIDFEQLFEKVERLLAER